MTGTPTEMPYAAFGATAPSSSALAGVADHAAFVRLQLRRGLSITGHRVVSEANLAACWTPGVKITFAPGFEPDAKSIHYALGWFHEEFTDGTAAPAPRGRPGPYGGTPLRGRQLVVEREPVGLMMQPLPGITGQRAARHHLYAGGVVLNPSPTIWPSGGTIATGALLVPGVTPARALRLLRMMAACR